MVDIPSIHSPTHRPELGRIAQNPPTPHPDVYMPGESAPEETSSMSRRRLASNRPSFALKRLVSLPRNPPFKLELSLPSTPIPVTPLDQIISTPTQPPEIDALATITARSKMVHEPSPTEELVRLRLPRQLSYSKYYRGLLTPTTPQYDINLTLASPADIDP